jgi:hypothetical protein
MQSDIFRQHAKTCFRLAIGAGDPEISQQLITIAGEWLAEAAKAGLEDLDCTSIKQRLVVASRFVEPGPLIANKH